MYETCFGFRQRPFRETASLNTYFAGESIEQTRLSIIRTIERASGVGLVVGPAGTGKTLLCRLIAEHFRKTLDVVSLSSARICTRRALLQNILFELKLPYRDMAEGELRLSLLDRLHQVGERHLPMLLIIDEAHSLPLRLLDELRLITNVVHNGEPCVRLLIVGGPALDEKFANPKLESLNQRVAARCYLHPFNRSQTGEYVRHQLRVAGVLPEDLMDESAARAIYSATDGIPRLVNQLCDHALVLAAAAGKSCLDSIAVEDAWTDLQQLPMPARTSPLQKSTATESKASVIEFGSLSVDDEELDAPATSEHDTLPEIHLAELDNETPVTISHGESRNDVPTYPLPSVFDDRANTVPIWENETVTFKDRSATTGAQDTEFAVPFGGDFEEEEVVVCHYSSLESKQSRGRPRVTSNEGAEIAAAIEWWDANDEQQVAIPSEVKIVTPIEREQIVPSAPPLPPVTDEIGQVESQVVELNSLPPSPDDTFIWSSDVTSSFVPESFWAFDDQEFDYSTVEERSPDQSNEEVAIKLAVTGNDGADHTGADHSDHDDSHPASIPIRAVKSANEAHDDRDIIVVEDDEARQFQPSTSREPPSRKNREYRQLFSRLRHG